VRLPVVAVCRKKPDLERIRRALLDSVPGGERKWRLIERLVPARKHREVYLHHINLEWQDATALVDRFAINSYLPEPYAQRTSLPAHWPTARVATGPEARANILDGGRIMKYTFLVVATLGLNACKPASTTTNADCSPIWDITADGTDETIAWVDHAANPRFAIYHAGTPGEELDDLVCDKETKLVWTRDANPRGIDRPWSDAISYTRQPNVGNPLGARFGARMGWRLPTISEIQTLVDPSKCSPTGDLPLTDGVNPALPTGHPFLNVQATEDDGSTSITRKYWTATTSEVDDTEAMSFELTPQYCILAFAEDKTESYFIWPVRGGN